VTRDSLPTLTTLRPGDTERVGPEIGPALSELVLGLYPGDARRVREMRERFRVETDEEAVRIALRLCHGRHVADRRVEPSEDDDFFAEMSRKLEHEKDLQVEFDRIAARDFRSSE
jgi:hypothetical protein